MIGSTAIFESNKGKPAMVVLSMTDDGNGAFDLWLFHQRDNAIAHFVACAEREAAKGWFHPDDDDPAGYDDCPRSDIVAIGEWLSAKGGWYYSENICWRLTEAVVEDAPTLVSA